MNIPKISLSDINLQNFIRLPNRQRMLIGLGVALFLFFIGYFIVIRPVINRTQAARSAETDLLLQLQTKLKELDKLEQAERHFDSLKQLWTSLNQHLPKNSDMPNIVSVITKIGAADNINFTLVKPNETKTVGIYQVIPLNLEATGTYDDLARFLSHVAAQVNADFATVSLGMPPESAKKNNNVLHLTLILDIYLNYQGKQAPWDIPDTKK